MKNYSIVAAVVAIALVLAFITATYNSKEASPRSAASSGSSVSSVLPPAMNNTSNQQSVKVGIDPSNMSSQSATILPKQ